MSFSARQPSIFRSGVEYHSKAGHGIQLSSVVLLMFTLYIVGSHLRLSIHADGSLLIPMYLMLFSAAVVTFIHARQLITSIGMPLAGLALFLLIQPLLSTAPGSGELAALLSSLQLVVSIASAMIMIFALRRIDKSRVRKVVLVIWSVFIGIAFLEAMGLKPLVDQIRDVLYAGSGRIVYSAELRDLEIYGRVRSTAFASEPSFLADTLFSTILMVFFLDKNRGSVASWTRFLAMMAVSFLLSPSFKIVFYISAVFVWHFWPNTNRKLLMTILALTSAIAVLVVFQRPITDIIVGVAGSHMQTGSFFGRIGVAHDVGLAALTNRPLLGYGIGNENGLYYIIAQAWSESGAFSRCPWFVPFGATDLMTNGFWWQWSFLGLLGGVVYVLCILSLLRGVGVQRPWRALICTWIIWYSGFAFVDPRSWFVIVVFALGGLKAASKPNRAEDNEAVQPGARIHPMTGA